MDVAADPASACARLAAHVADLARSGVRDRGEFRLVLSGGSTPRGLYRVLAERYGSAIPWEGVTFFWGDERCVPPDHAESNYAMARETLLRRLPLPDSHMHRMRGELPSAEAAASQYDAELARLARPGDPLFDLVLLGLGQDGHTASLFPRSPALAERTRRVVGVEDPGEPPRVPRITLTLPALSSSREVAFLVTGVEKAPAIRGVFGSLPEGSPDLPASLVRAWEAERWYLDRGAASAAREALSGWEG